MDTKPKEAFRDVIMTACEILNKKSDYPLTSDELIKAVTRPMIELERAVTGETFWGRKIR